MVVIDWEEDIDLNTARGILANVCDQIRVQVGGVARVDPHTEFL